MQADLILTNGIVYAVDARRRRHRSLAVRNGRIVCVGGDAQVLSTRGPRTEVVDLGGRLVLPGFIDAHMHPKYAVCEVFQVDLSACTSIDACVTEVARFAARHPEYPDVRGWGWAPGTLAEQHMTAAALDALSPIDRSRCTTTASTCSG